ncbi:DNA polymerase III subunit beta [Oscillatoria sp. FACHB-1406]|uniref:DNA polymerase III subunit beta n=1 Tax=Oscillatoria sp. FACHB-1406 TaxID=2692846 RepID=UPI001688968A|nr:DNA polymerase III subunit beta [Oscillatoria sp. FACHB-1406]MBD2577152.1 DNA polymerase III subunit beta [Oscillatoria sp. FACHB-1406]
MKLACSTSDLNTHLSLAARAVPSRPTHPVLGNVLLIADEDTQKITLRAFDLSLGIQTTFSAQVQEGGTLTLPAKLLGDIVSRLSEGEIEIADEDAEEGTVSLHSTSGRYQLRTMDATEFPDLPEIEVAQTQQLPVEMLAEGIRSTLFAASSDDSKQVLTGIHLSSSTGGLEFAATDGHRLAVVSLVREEEETEEETEEANASPALEVTIPARALRELDRLLAVGEASEGVTLSLDESQVAFELENRRLTSRQVEGAYPTYSQLIPKEFSLSASLDRKQLISALERVAVLTDSKNHVVKFSLDSDRQELELSVDTIDVGKAREVLPIQISGESIAVAFNVKYLMDGLKALPTSEIQMQMNQPKQPVIFTPLGGIKMTYLVMPVQMRD